MEERRKNYPKECFEGVDSRLEIMESKIDDLIAANKTALKIITGNGDPKSGLFFKVASLEESKTKKDTHMAGLFGVVGLVVAGVLTDWCNRIFFSHHH